MKRAISLLLLFCGSARAMTESAVLANGLISCRFVKLSNRHEKLLELVKHLHENKENVKKEEVSHLRNEHLVLVQAVKNDMKILRIHSLHFYRRFRRELLNPLLAVEI